MCSSFYPLTFWFGDRHLSQKSKVVDSSFVVVVALRAIDPRRDVMTIKDATIDFIFFFFEYATMKMNLSPSWCCARADSSSRVNFLFVGSIDDIIAVWIWPPVVIDSRPHLWNATRGNDTQTPKPIFTAAEQTKDNNYTNGSTLVSSN